MKVVLLLAGKGTRFLPLTETTPKPLIRVAGAPVLAHILHSLKQLVIDELIVITGYLSQPIETYLNATYKGAYRVIRQETLDGTGGAVYAARDCLDGPVLVVFGDTIFEADLSGLNGNRSENVIWTRQVEDFQRFGIVHKNSHGDMVEIIEKPLRDVGRSANIGLYFLADYAALCAGLDHVMSQPPIAGEYYFTYALNHMVKHGCKIKVRDVDGWHDCGTLSALIATNHHLLSRGSASQSFVGSGVVLMPPVNIHATVELVDSQIGPNVTIDAGSRVIASSISHAIVGRNCIIDNASVNGSLVGDDEILSRRTANGCIIANGTTKNT